MTPQGGVLARHLREVGYTGGFFSAHPLEIDPAVTKSSGPLVGTWFVGTDERAATEYRARYAREFKTPAGIGATNGYDVGKMMIEAIKSSDSSEYLRNLKRFHGVLGTYNASPDGGFDFAGAVRIVTSSGIIDAGRGVVESGPPQS